MQPIETRHIARALRWTLLAVAVSLLFPTGALARGGNVWWSSDVARDDLRWELRADGRKGIRLNCTPVERTHVWGDNYRVHDCWAGWGNSRSWYRTAYLYRAAAWPDFYVIKEQPYGLCKVGKKWRRVVHVRGHHIQKCKSTRRDA